MMATKGTEMVPIAQELSTKMSQFKAALAGSGVSPQRFIRVVMTAVNIDPNLLSCDRRSLINAAMRAASDGLVPDGQDGALVPFQGKVVWMPMIGGIRKKVRRSGEISTWDVTAVHAKDLFDYQLGDDPFIKHKPYVPGPIPERTEGESDIDWNKRVRAHISRGELTHVYSVAKIKSGGDLSRDVMSRAEVELVRDTYAKKDSKGQFSPAWRKSFPEMAKKTVARRHAKSLPMSTDVLSLLSRDDELYDLERERGERIQAPRVLDDRLELLAGVDSETGEFPDAEGGAMTSPSQRDGVSTPPSHRVAPDDDVSGVGAGDSEGAAQPSESGAAVPHVPDEADDGVGVGTRPVVTLPEQGLPQPPSSQAPPGEAQTPPQAPGGSSRKTPKTAQPIEQAGEAMARKGRQDLERWVMELPPDDMAKVSLAQLKAWRNVADKVSA
jgi:recombination protein RecT